MNLELFTTSANTDTHIELSRIRLNPFTSVKTVIPKALLHIYSVCRCNHFVYIRIKDLSFNAFLCGF